MQTVAEKTTIVAKSATPPTQRPKAARPMLDAETKRRIDTCRDILVGKVPDPKSQVEQITIALIYKFMDDMDSEAEDLGGKRSFFAGDFAHYGWARLKAPELSGKEKLDLYAEAIGKMNENPGIPALFRDIFKNAYLPYRDPETLRAFLKEIDGFTYEHSERLGDAFEYLLSVLGSQGDAGQFRTPRHIIDFMVEVIDPQKHESILDPACGTAGFLISAWKHIFAKNAKDRPGDHLTPDERQNLAANIRGYDISPDMVRLSLVNLYLHGFTDPHIVEYDTLTSEERWNETADVILANPPFMSPKGGIKPHKRFSVQATRSEVLFVDYMAEHLSPQGRAAIVVPEGIIFQSGTAYKKLREMLVKNSLIAVVSLPAGVFNPYSGVKTSILILDKRLAKTCDSVLFVKVENDGFGLGAQRRAVTGSDLPGAKRLLEVFFSAPGDFENGVAAHKVSRAKIGENGDWGLGGDRYLTGKPTNADHPWVELGAVCNIVNGSTPSKSESRYWDAEDIPWFTVDDIRQFGRRITRTTKFVTQLALDDTSLRLLPAKTVLLCCTASVGEYAIAEIPLTTNQQFNGLVIRPECSDKLVPDFLFVVAQQFKDELIRLSGKTSFNFVSGGVLKTLKIPLPPLAIQQEIVAEIEGYQKIIDGARLVVENYRPRIDVQPDWPMVALGEVCERIMDGTHFSPSNTETGEKLYITSKNVRENYLDLSNISYISEESHKSIYSRCPVRTGDVLYIKDGANTGLAAINSLTEEFSLLSSVAVLRGKPEALENRYLAFYLNSKRGRQSMLSLISGVAITRLTLTKLNAAQIPLPPLESQSLIVAEIEAEQALVDANKQLITRFEAKIKATIDRVWGSGEAA